MKLNIRRKLSLAFLSILVLMSISSAVSIYLSQLVLQTSYHVVDEQYPSMKALDQITILLYEKRVAYARFFVSRDLVHYERMREIDQLIKEHGRVFLELPLNPDEWQIVSKYRPAMRQYFDQLELAAERFKAPKANFAEVMNLVDEADKLLDTNVLPLVEELHRMKQLQTGTLVTELRGNLQLSSQVTLIISILMILIAIFVAVALGRNISRPLIVLTDAAEAISLGDFSTPIQIDSQDEIGDLARAIDRMRQSLQKAMDRLRKRHQKE